MNVLNLVRRPKVGHRDTLAVFTLSFRLHVGAVNTLIADNPGQRAAFFANRFLQQHQCLHVSFRARWTARNVHVDRQELVHALYHGIDILHAAGVGTGTHGDHPFWFQHLFVQTLNNRGHLGKAGTGHHHQVSLTR